MNNQQQKIVNTVSDIIDYSNNLKRKLLTNRSEDISFVNETLEDIKACIREIEGDIRQGVVDESIFECSDDELEYYKSIIEQNVIWRNP